MHTFLSQFFNCFHSFYRAFPQRWCTLYLAIIAKLTLSYVKGCFYTYHNLFSAKCPVRVTQWNHSAYWGILEPGLHSKVFLGCRNFLCAIYSPVAHPTMICPQINLSITPCLDTTPAKSTSYVRRPAATVAYQYFRSRTPPFSQIAGSPAIVLILGTLNKK